MQRPSGSAVALIPSQTLPKSTGRPGPYRTISSSYVTSLKDPHVWKAAQLGLSELSDATRPELSGSEVQIKKARKAEAAPNSGLSGGTADKLEH